MKILMRELHGQFHLYRIVVFWGKASKLKTTAPILNKASKSVCWVLRAWFRLWFRYGEGVGVSVGTGQGCPMPGTACSASSEQGTAGPGSYIRGALVKNGASKEPKCQAMRMRRKG